MEDGPSMLTGLMSDGLEKEELQLAYLGAFTGGSFSLDKQESFDFSLEATATQPPERMVAPEVSTFGVISPFSDATIGLQIAPTLAITSINTDIAPSSHTSSPTTPPGVAVVASELVAPTGTEIGLTPSQIDREISVVYPESLSPPQPPEPLPSIDLTSRPPFSAVYHDPEVNLSLLNEIRKKSAFFFAVMLLTFVFSQKTFADSNPMQDALLERMTEAGWRNIEIDGCRVRFIYGRVPPCDDGKPQFFEQEFRLQNVRWQDVSEIFSDGTQTTTNYFVTFQPSGRYFQEVINLPNVNAEIRQEFPNSKWPMKLGPETKEISELIYSQIPRSSPYNWRFFHACYGEVPTLEHGLMLIFERETDARLVTDALVSYAGTQSCTTD